MMADPQNNFRRFEGLDHPEHDPWAMTPKDIMYRFGFLCGLAGLFVGWLSNAIFITI